MRRAEKSDEAFLETVYADSRREELAAFGWAREQEYAFFKMQFGLQKGAYAMQFPGAEYSVVELKGAPVGRLIVYRGETEFRLVDVAILAEFRGRGVGEILIEDLKTQATSETPLDLRVLKTNGAAKKFYERLGFKVVEEADLHFSMRWQKKK